MTAWDILIANSTAPNGSIAWLHLNSQTGGGLIGGRADLAITATSEVLATQDNNESIDLISGSEGITLNADSKGLEV